MSEDPAAFKWKLRKLAVDKEFEEFIERAAAKITPEDGEEAINALAEGLQIPREEMVRIAREQLGYEPPANH